MQKLFPYIPFSIFLTIGILFLSGISQATILFQFPEELRNDFKPYVIGFGQLLFMLLPTYFAARQIPMPIDETFRLRKYSVVKHYLLSILGLLAIQLFIPGYLSLQESLVPESWMDIYSLMKNELEAIYSELLGGTTTTEALRALAIGAVLPAICEEFLFRGFLQRSLEEKISYIKAILLSSGLFSIIHLNPVNFIPLFIIGFYFGFIAFSTKSIIIPIILHFLNNFFAIIILYIPKLTEMNENSTLLNPALAAFISIFSLCIIAICSYLIYRDTKSNNFSSNLSKED